MNTEFSKHGGGNLTIGGTTKAADLLTLGTGSSTTFTGALTASGGLTVAEGASVTVNAASSAVTGTTALGRWAGYVSGPVLCPGLLHAPYSPSGSMVHPALRVDCLCHFGDVRFLGGLTGALKRHAFSRQTFEMISGKIR